MTTVTANAPHMPRNFDPMGYTFIDAFDSCAGDPGARGSLPAEPIYVSDFDLTVVAYSPYGAAKQACQQALASSPSSTFEKGNRGTQCDHCGAHLRYVCVLRHNTTGDYIAVGETCLDNRVGSMNRATWKIKQLREAAQRARQAEKNREAREQWLAANPKAAAILAREDLGWCYLVSGVRDALQKYGNVFESKTTRMIEFVEESDRRNAERTAREEERAREVRVDAPEGRVEIDGVVVSRKIKEGDYGTFVKLVIVCGTGDGVFAVYVTEPSKIECERGDFVKMRATLKRSDRDSTFAFGKKPSNFEVIEHRDDVPELDSLDALEDGAW